MPTDAWGAHSGSYSLVVDPVGASLLALVEREAGQRLLTLDPNVRLNVEPDAARWRDRIEEFVAQVDLVKASDEDLALLYPGAEPGGIARNWLSASASVVILTRGQDGAEAFGNFGQVSVPAAKVDVMDAVRAGDTFQAALIVGLAERGIRSSDPLRALGSGDFTDLLTFAAQAAAIVCSRRGADMPTCSEVENFYQGPR